MDRNQYIELLERFFLGTATDEEINNLKNWIKDPQSRELCYTWYEQYWTQAGNYMDPDIQQDILDDLFQKIEDPVEEQHLVATKREFSISPRIASIAAACLLLIVGSTLYYAINKPALGADIILAVKNAQKAEITLTDGTVVYVNSDSRLISDHSYNYKDRIITLEGEAYFEVAKDKGKPFVVHVNGIYIEALGTSFNVKAYLNDPVISVILIEGRVKVTDDEGHNEEFLEPNERLEYNRINKSFEKSEIHPNANHLLWRSDELVFYDESLEEICHTLTRMYNVEFIFMTEEIKEYTFTGVIKNNSLMNVLEFMSQTASVKYKINPDNTIIMEKK